jgi:peptide-methionine (S)-S-oxide reductase
VHGSSHSTAAAISLSTAFLAPEMGMLPRKGEPPSITYVLDWGRPASPPSPPGSASAILHTNCMATHDESRFETATLGGGCFWCLEAVYNELRGVERVISGYAGGHVPQPTYEQVCSGRTGHAEVVQVTFDPDVISYREILEVFFTIHDPTTLDRQGADVGTQYRSVIFYQSPEQEQVAREVMAETSGSGIWRASLVTQLEPLDGFYPAEGYHQNYFERNAGQPYCQIVIAPKVAKVRERYLARLKRG